MKNFLITVVSFMDVYEQPIRIQSLVRHSDPRKAVGEVLTHLEKSTLLNSCIRSVSVEVLREDYDYLQMYKLPNTLI